MKRVSTGRGSKKTEGASEGTTRAGAVQEPRGLEAGAERRTAAGPRAIGTMLDRLVGKAGHRRGFGEARILTEWAAVVGEELAGCTLPERIARSRNAKDGGGGVLHLRVQSGWAPSVQHMGPVIVERINGYLGYAAIDRIALRQGIVAPPRRRGPPPRRALAPDERADLEAALRGVDDPDLAAALRALGEAVLAREENRTAARRDAPTPPSR